MAFKFFQANRNPLVAAVETDSQLNEKVYAPATILLGVDGVSAATLANPVPTSASLSGATVSSAVAATAADPTYTEGSTTNPVSTDLAGYSRVVLKNQTSTWGTNADSAYAGSGNASIISALKGIYAKLAASIAVTGTFWQATQPVSIASMPSTPVTGTFWQATQPVSGTFWQATQPVSAASLPLPSNAAAETGGNLATINSNLAGPASVSRIPSAAGSTNATSAKGSAGRLYKVSAYNTTTTLKYLKVYNKASAPTVGTDTPVHTFPIPPSGGMVIDWPTGFAYATGIAYALTGGAADNDSTGLSSGDVVGVNVEYA